MAFRSLQTVSSFPTSQPTARQRTWFPAPSPRRRSESGSWAPEARIRPRIASMSEAAEASSSSARRFGRGSSPRRRGPPHHRPLDRPPPGRRKDSRPPCEAACRLLRPHRWVPFALARPLGPLGPRTPPAARAPPPGTIFVKIREVTRNRHPQVSRRRGVTRESGLFPAAWFPLQSRRRSTDHHLPSAPCQGRVVRTDSDRHRELYVHTGNDGHREFQAKVLNTS